MVFNVSSVDGSPTGAGRSTKRLTMEKMVAFAPIRADGENGNRRDHAMLAQRAQP